MNFENLSFQIFENLIFKNLKIQILKNLNFQIGHFVRLDHFRVILPGRWSRNSDPVTLGRF